MNDNSKRNSVSTSSVVVPEMKWVLLPGGSNGTCVSNTDCCSNIFCYGLEYTPGNTGDLTSYTTAFFTDCVMNGSPVSTNESCVMTDNSTEVNGCTQYNLIQIQCSGNTGTLDVTAGVPVIIHQVCFTLSSGTTISVIEDEVTDLTTSIDLPGNGGFMTEYPEFVACNIGHMNVVTNANDNGIGSFRHVVDCTGSGDTIIFDEGLMNQTITLTTGAIQIDKHLTIVGPGVLDLTLSGNNTSVIFHVLPGFDLGLKDIALKNGSALLHGGALYAEGNVTFHNVLLENNFENGIPKSMTVTGSSLVTIVGLTEMKN